MSGRFHDPDYAARRSTTFIVALNCTGCTQTCFCASMGTGPGAESGFDLALTELTAPEHAFLVEAGTEAGAALLEEMDVRDAKPEEIEAAEDAVHAAADEMGRSLDLDGIHDLLLGNLEHPRWQQVGSRCLACTNCTMACPTCFCHKVEDYTDLTGAQAERRRTWDSCFTLEFTHFGPGSVRSSTAGRYRQWMTHKLSHWYEQFGTSGCVGCGRCITWCPVGIDITEEALAIKESERA